MKKILFDFSGDSEWIGGYYYPKNIIYQLVIGGALESIDIIAVCDESIAKLFAPIKEKIKILKYKQGSRMGRLKSLLIGTLKTDYIYYYHRYKFDFLNLLSKKAIYWIPDFQEKSFPDLFTTKQLASRKQRAEFISNSISPLVLSSEDCKKDFINYYHSRKQNVFVVHFVSYIIEELKPLNRKYEDQILKKYSLKPSSFICVSNQFWQHKNHIVIFKALEYLYQKGNLGDIMVVMTGKPNDFRNPEYFDKLMKHINNSHIKNNIKILGFVDRTEQLCLIKNSSYIIQPSLFEGWGAVLEDAKVLDKHILLSDIPVHHEQMNYKFILFDPYSYEDLASKMMLMKKVYSENVKDGICDMKTRAKLYSDEFMQLIQYLSK